MTKKHDQKKPQAPKSTPKLPPLVPTIAKIFSGKGRVVHEPGEELRSDETVVGVVKNKRTRALYSYLMTCLRFLEAQEMKAMRGLCSIAVVPEDAVEAMSGLHFGSQAARAAGELFWSSVRKDTPGLEGYSFIGIRKGWRVVRKTSEEKGSWARDQVVQYRLRQESAGVGSGMSALAALLLQCVS